MITDDYAALDTPQLLTLYAELLRRARISRPVTDILDLFTGKTPPEAAKETGEKGIAEFASAVAPMKAIATELRSREAFLEIRNLFFDDDPDVRMGAVAQFADIDPETSAAAAHTLVAGLTTREVLALRLSARTPPPSRPGLKEMSDDALVVRFEDAGLRESAAQLLDPTDEPDDQETQNRIAIEVVDILQELKARGLLPRLLPLLTNPNLRIRFRAAQGCLRLAEQEATAALESVAKSKNFDDRWAARNALARWHEGKCLIDGL
jgi:HEAT repeat protein